MINNSWPIRPIPDPWVSLNFIRDLCVLFSPQPSCNAIWYMFVENSEQKVILLCSPSHSGDPPHFAIINLHSLCSHTHTRQAHLNTQTYTKFLEKKDCFKRINIWNSIRNEVCHRQVIQKHKLRRFQDSASPLTHHQAKEGALLLDVWIQKAANSWTSAQFIFVCLHPSVISLHYVMVWRVFVLNTK